MCKGLFKVLNVQNVKKKLSKDVQNAKVFGIVQGTAKSLTGHPTRSNAIKEQNNYNKYRKKANKQSKINQI